MFKQHLLNLLGSSADDDANYLHVFAHTAQVGVGENASSSEDDDDDRGDFNGIDRITSSTTLL